MARTSALDIAMPPDEPERARDERHGDASEAALDATREFVAEELFSGAQGTPQRLGEFQLVRELGRGGMGTVYEAQDLSLGRRVALKVLRFGALGDAAAVERFQREAATVAKLHHTNIVPIFSVGSLDGVHYYAMQLIEGRTLADALRDGPVDVRRAAQWALQASEALAHAHRHGVIHRDVKPSNILLDGDERIWLTDFGLARRLDDPALTATDALLGTPRYMSPEQASLKRSEIDHRTDIYSLGATLYELMAGRPAFEGESSHQVIQAILTTDPDPPRRLRADVPRDLDTIVMKCLAKEPACRYALAGEVADELRRYLAGEPIRAARAFSEPGWRKVRQGLVMVILSLLAMFTITVLAGLLTLLSIPFLLGVLPMAITALSLLGLIGKWRCVGVPSRSGLRGPISGACLALTYSWTYAACAHIHANTQLLPRPSGPGPGWSERLAGTANLAALVGTAGFLYFLCRTAKFSRDDKLIRRANRLLVSSPVIAFAYLFLGRLNPEAVSRQPGPLGMLLLMGAIYWLWCYVALMSSLGEKIGDAQPP